MLKVDTGAFRPRMKSAETWIFQEVCTVRRASTTCFPAKVLLGQTPEPDASDTAITVESAREAEVQQWCHVFSPRTNVLSETAGEQSFCSIVHENPSERKNPSDLRVGLFLIVCRFFGKIKWAPPWAWFFVRDESS